MHLQCLAYARQKVPDQCTVVLLLCFLLPHCCPCMFAWLQSTGFGGYGTEDESTPARRRYQQQAAAAAVAAAAAAKEQGGVQRSIKFPPLGAHGPAAGSGLLRGYGSSSQVGSLLGGWLSWGIGGH